MTKLRLSNTAVKHYYIMIIEYGFKKGLVVTSIPPWELLMLQKSVSLWGAYFYVTLTM